MTNRNLLSFLMISLFVLKAEAIILRSTPDAQKEQAQPQRSLAFYHDGVKYVKENKYYQSAHKKAKPIGEKVGNWHSNNWFMFILYGLVFLFLIGWIVKLKRKGSRRLFTSNRNLYSSRRLGSEFGKLMKMRRLSNLNSTQDFNNINTRRKIFYITDGLSKRLVNRRLSQRNFDKEYPRMVGFLTHRARQLQNHGLPELLKLVNDYAKTYRGIDLSKNKMALMMNLGRIMNSLPAAMQLFNN